MCSDVRAPTLLGPFTADAFGTVSIGSLST
jgi:hypothetical protein